MSDNLGCSSVELINKAIDSLDNHQNDINSKNKAVNTLKAVQETHTQSLSVYRSLTEFEDFVFQNSNDNDNDNNKLLSYEEGIKLRTTDGKRFFNEMQFGNCHDGQTKLTLGLLEFLKKAVDAYGEYIQMHLVYVGASSVAAYAAMLAFPQIRQTIFDPAENMEGLMPPVYRENSLVTDKIEDLNKNNANIALKTFFDDNTPGILHQQRFLDERILYVSDIRINSENEEGIASDMIMQQEWAESLNCDMYMFKFRLPYTTRFSTAEEISQNFYSPKGTAMNPPIEHMPGNIFYLSGDLMIQPYPPVGSGELRLIGKRGDDGELVYTHHDMKQIEDLVFNHNHFWRGNAMFHIAETPETQKGYPYDVAVEKYILNYIDDDKRRSVEDFINGSRAGFNKATYKKCVSNATKGAPPGSLGSQIKQGCGEAPPPITRSTGKYVPPGLRFGNRSGSDSARWGGGGGSVNWIASFAMMMAVTFASSFVPR
jgi:hypothetical protein